MKYVQDIITDARRLSRNEDFSVDSTSGAVTGGQGNDELLRYINDAQDLLQSKISNAHSSVSPFASSQEITTVADQRAYSVNDRVFYNKEFITIRYSHSGNLSDYGRPLDKLHPMNDISDAAEYPVGYYRQGGYFYPVPIINRANAKFEVKYERSLDDLALRVGTVTARTLSSTQLTALTISTATDDANAIANVSDKYLCVSDKDGVVKMRNIPFTSYASGTGVFTLDPFTFATGETVAVGDFITLGKYTTTHSKLADECESYLSYYCACILLGPKDVTGAYNRLSEILWGKGGMEETIIKMYKQQSQEIDRIPQQDFWNY